MQATMRIIFKSNAAKIIKMLQHKEVTFVGPW